MMACSVEESRHVRHFLPSLGTKSRLNFPSKTRELKKIDVVRLKSAEQLQVVAKSRRMSADIVAVGFLESWFTIEKASVVKPFGDTYRT